MNLAFGRNADSSLASPGFAWPLQPQPTQHHSGKENRTEDEREVVGILKW